MAHASTADARTGARQVQQSLAHHVDAARLRLDVRVCARVPFGALLPDSANSHGESSRFASTQYGFGERLSSRGVDIVCTTFDLHAWATTNISCVSIQVSTLRPAS